ncbi:hypothetical protein P4S88_17105 [Anoxybacillus geothermalis]|nr:hypothetical protein GARCT_02089 [Geobacillus sp. 12AMOR1]MED0655704.1 hypothetical protein [Anoxybacillus geothermalis]STO12497.1 Uncharacterised protein [[Flavobacterium] thermophilum]
MKRKPDNQRAGHPARAADTRTAGRTAMKEQTVQEAYEAYKEREELTADSIKKREKGRFLSLAFLRLSMLF